MQKLKITRVSATDKRKDSRILEGKYGTFWRVGIQAEEYGDQWINGFSNKHPEYEAGDTIEVVVTTEEWQGKEQLKFKMASDEDKQAQKIKDLEAQLQEKNANKPEEETVVAEPTEEF